MLLHGKLRDIGLGKVPVDYKMRFPKSKSVAEQHFFCEGHAAGGNPSCRCEWTPPSDVLREIKRLEAEAFVGDSLREDIGRQLMVLYADFPVRGRPPFCSGGLVSAAIIDECKGI